MTLLTDETTAILRHFGGANERTWPLAVALYESSCENLIGRRGSEMGGAAILYTAIVLMLASRPCGEADSMRVAAAALVRIADGLELHADGGIRFADAIGDRRPL